MFLEQERSADEQKFLKGISKQLVDSPVEIYHLEYFPATKMIRLFIINPATDTATIDECVAVDHLLTPFFEENDWIPQDIVLEVSSPGATRCLYREADFQNAIEKKVKCIFNKKIDEKILSTDDKRIIGQKKILGILRGVDADGITVEFYEKPYTIAFEHLKQVNIELDI